MKYQVLESTTLLFEQSFLSISLLAFDPRRMLPIRIQFCSQKTFFLASFFLSPKKEQKKIRDSKQSFSPNSSSEKKRLPSSFLQTWKCPSKKSFLHYSCSTTFFPLENIILTHRHSSKSKYFLLFLARDGHRLYGAEPERPGRLPGQDAGQPVRRRRRRRGRAAAQPQHGHNGHDGDGGAAAGRAGAAALHGGGAAARRGRGRRGGATGRQRERDRRRGRREGPFQTGLPQGLPSDPTPH